MKTQRFLLRTTSLLAILFLVVLQSASPGATPSADEGLLWAAAGIEFILAAVPVYRRPRWLQPWLLGAAGLWLLAQQRVERQERLARQGRSIAPDWTQRS